MKIVLIGASGYLGAALYSYFSGAQIVVVSRSKPDFEAPFFAWDGENGGDWTNALENADAVINLAGRTVNCRYNEQNKREILESRTKSTRAISQAISKAKNPPRVWLNASTATIYRAERERDLDENGPIGDGFSVSVAQKWEQALFEEDLPQTRRVALRMSMIFGKSAPVFEVFSRLAKLGLAGPQGDGNQYVSWIHERDCCRALEFLIRNPLEGAVNVCAPHPIPNREFLRVLRRGLGAPFGIPAPKFAMEIGAFLMRTETELPLKSRRVVPSRLLKSGFRFDFTARHRAAHDLYRS